LGILSLVGDQRSEGRRRMTGDGRPPVKQIQTGLTGKTELVFFEKFNPDAGFGSILLLPNIKAIEMLKSLMLLTTKIRRKQNWKH
jgi:hypothetical protein